MFQEIHVDRNAVVSSMAGVLLGRAPSVDAAHIGTLVARNVCFDEDDENEQAADEGLQDAARLS